MKKLLLLAPLIALSACATTGTKTATAEELAQCRAMAQQMGTNTAHDHGEMKGAGPSAMNFTHQRCREIRKQQ